MVELSYNDMHRMMDAGMAAYEYAWNHYDELNGREAKYVLYSPRAYGLGVLAAGFPVSPKDRILQTKTRRKNYLQYELDENFQVLRIRHINRYNHIDCTYHLFEKEGILFARPFLQDRKGFYRKIVYAVQITNGDPVFFAEMNDKRLCVDFYAYPNPNTVAISTVLYQPNSKYTSAGQLMSFDAPYGANNSPVSLDYREEEYHRLNFADYFP